MANNPREARINRQKRVRYSIVKFNKGRLRLSVFRSNKHMYAQIIDDAKGITVLSASTLEKDVSPKDNNGADVEAATLVGKKIAERALDMDITQVVFDRGGYRYHGRTKALAEAAREAGLKF